jgi:hypothetical protein
MNVPVKRDADSSRFMAASQPDRSSGKYTKLAVFLAFAAVKRYVPLRW